MCYNKTEDISTLNGSSLKLADKFTYLGSNVSSTETDIDTRLTKAERAIGWLSVLWKSDLTNKIKLSILLYGCTIWLLTKWLKKKLDGNYTRMLRGNTPQSSSYRATYHPSRSLSKLDEPDMQDNAGEVGTSSLVMYYGTLHMTEQKQGDQLEPTYSSSVRIRGVALRTNRKRWTIGRSGEKGSVILTFFLLERLFEHPPLPERLFEPRTLPVWLFQPSFFWISYSNSLFPVLEWQFEHSTLLVAILTPFVLQWLFEHGFSWAPLRTSSRVSVSILTRLHFRVAIWLHSLIEWLSEHFPPFQ